MSQILLLFFVLIFSKAEAQSCIGCDTNQLKQEVQEIEGPVEMFYSSAGYYSYYVSNSKDSVQKIWRLEDDTVTSHVIVLKQPKLIGQLNNEFDKKYKKIKYGQWSIPDKKILVTLELSQDNIPFYKFTKQ